MSVFAAKKKKDEPQKPSPVIDYSNIVWPNPPAIARIRYQAFYAAEKLSQVDTPKTKKDSWMDRLAGTTPQADSGKVLWQLAEPYGMAMDSKGNLYVADQKVGAIFIFNTETREVQLIKNKTHAHFVRIIGLAMDDDDRLFVSDPGLQPYSGIQREARGRGRNHRGTGETGRHGDRYARTGCSMFPTSIRTRFWSTTLIR